MNYEIGMTVKAFDFPNSDDHWMMGQIKEIREYTIVLDTMFRCWDGKLVETDDCDEFETPKLGQSMNDKISKRPRLQILKNPRSYKLA